MNGSDAHSLGSLVSTAAAKANPERLPTVLRSGLPEWADAAILSGEPNAYFDAEQAARSLSPAQRQGLPSLIQSVVARMDGVGSEAKATLAETLLGIAIRVQPGITENAGLAWASNLMDSLSKLPGDLVVKAIDAARFTQFQYLNEVGPFIEAEIAEPLRVRQAKLTRLREIEKKAEALAAEKKAPAEDPAKIAAEIEFFKAKLAEKGRGDKANAEEARKVRMNRPPVDWDAHARQNLRDTNVVRVMKGLDPLTMDELRIQTVNQARRYLGKPMIHPDMTAEEIAQANAGGGA